MPAISRLLAAETGMLERAVIILMRSAPVRYKRYTIAKRSGGQRWIAQPAREIKILQRALIRVLLNKLPIHDAATAYRTGKSILDNARCHRGDGPILKLDFADFFPNIRASDWRAYCRDTGCLEADEDVELATQLLFHRVRDQRELRLAIGAPSSPVLSNVLMFNFDREVARAVSDQGVAYTRYADDLTFSAPRTGHLNSVRPALQKILRDIPYPHIRINEDKTVVATRKYKRFVTGLVLSNDGRVTIGRERKRLLSAGVHQASLGKLEKMELFRLAGYLAFVHSVEPEYLDVLRRRYGVELLQQLTVAVAREAISSQAERDISV